MLKKLAFRLYTRTTVHA